MGCPHISSECISLWVLQEHQQCVSDHNFCNMSRLTTVNNYPHYRRLYCAGRRWLHRAICGRADQSICLCSDLGFDLRCRSSNGYCSAVGRSIFCRLLRAIRRLLRRHGGGGRGGWYDAVGLYAGGHRALGFGVWRDDRRRNRRGTGSGSHGDCLIVDCLNLAQRVTGQAPRRGVQASW